MTRRRALLARVESGGRLPSAYQEVEYLESTGVQYINTGLSPSGDLSFDCKFYTYHDGAPGYGNIFGSRINSNVYEYQLTAYQSGIVSVGTRSPARFLTNRINVVSFDGTNVIVNGATKDFVGSKDMGNNNYPIILFGILQGGVVTQLESDRIYYCIFGNERDFVPCYRKSDSKPGMYDLVTNTFFTNDGTGDFLVGADVNY